MTLKAVIIKLYQSFIIPPSEATICILVYNGDSDDVARPHVLLVLIAATTSLKYSQPGCHMSN